MEWAQVPKVPNSCFSPLTTEQVSVSQHLAPPWHESHFLLSVEAAGQELDGQNARLAPSKAMTEVL